MKGLSASIGGVQVGSQQVAKTAASARPAAETQTRHAAAVTGSRRATPGDLGAAHGGRTECGRAIGRADGLPGVGKGLTEDPFFTAFPSRFFGAGNTPRAILPARLTRPAADFYESAELTRSCDRAPREARFFFAF